MRNMKPMPTRITTMKRMMSIGVQPSFGESPEEGIMSVMVHTGSDVGAKAETRFCLLRFEEYVFEGLEVLDEAGNRGFIV